MAHGDATSRHTYAMWTSCLPFPSWSCYTIALVALCLLHCYLSISVLRISCVLAFIFESLRISASVYTTVSYILSFLFHI